MTVLATGLTVEGDHWQLSHDVGPMGETVMVDVTTAAGRRLWGTGCGLAAPPLTEPLTLAGGSDDAGPTVLVLHLRADVRAAVVRLSDGTREDLRLYPLPGRTDRVAVLVHPRHLDVHRIDLHDGTGARFPDPAPLG